MRESLRWLQASDELMTRAGGERRVRVELMDGEHINIDVDRKARGSDLLDKVCEELNIEDVDYFGLLHTQRGDPRVWVDLNRRLSKTFRNEPWDVRFSVKFYPPDPTELTDDITRYQLTLAIRRDLMEGRLTCSCITHALLASYVLQAELGDLPAAGELPQTHALVPPHLMTDDLQEQIQDLYRKHRGQTPAEAEWKYLESAARLPLYGASLHAARDSQHADLVLALAAAGLAVCRDGVIMNRFPWAKISKLSYKKRWFSVKLRPSEFDECETTLSFLLPHTRAAKLLWTSSVEHHMFFRRACPVAVRRVALFPRLGSRRLSCRRTLQQLREQRPPQLAS